MTQWGRSPRAWCIMANLMVLVLSLTAFLFHVGAANHITTAASVIWVDNQQAVVTFTSNGDGTSTAHVTVNTVYTYAVHENPVDHTINPSMRCSTDYTGSNLTQPLDFNHDATDRTINIPINQLAFRSIVVYNVNGSELACGTILPITNLLDATALKAVFTSTVAGIVYLAQIGDETFIYGKLFFTGAQNTTSDLNLVVLGSSVPFSDANVGDCSAGGSVSQTLTSQLVVSSAPQPYSEGAFRLSTSLDLDSVSNLTLAVTDSSGTIWSCALLQALHDVGASYDSITSPAITQRFPHYFATVLDNRIRTYDVLSDASSPSEACMDRNAIFNPWGEDPAVGDLPRRGVVLPNDIPGVPLIGSASIVAHKLNNSACSFLKPASSELARVVMATVSFDADGVTGSIIMRQMIYNDGSFGPTFVSVDVYYNSITQATMGHNWHVHQLRRGAGGECFGVVLGHYDPFLTKVEGKDTYGAECGPDAQLRCEMGDLAEKHGKMTVEGAGVSPRSTFAGYDYNLHLTGPYTVLGRSIVIHNHLNSSQYLTCANIDPAILSDTVVAITFPQGDIDSTDLNFRLDLAATVANAAGIPLGDLLVYDVVSITTNQQSCLNATLRFTGLSVDDADTKATAVSNVDTSDLGMYSPGLCTPTSSAGAAKIPGLLVAMLTVVAILFTQRQ